MQAGEYDRTGMELPAVMRTVYIDGQRVDDTWLLGTTIEAEIASDLPEIVAGVGSTGQPRYGTVVIGPRSDVDEAAPTPLNREGIWPPQRGQSVVIEDATSDQRWRRATGVVVDVNAPIGEQNVTISWRDGMDDLVSSVELPPIAHQMPGYEQNVGGELRRYWHRTGIEPWGIFCEAMEDAGYRILPSIPDVDFYCLFQGKAFPRIGRIQQTYSAGDLLAWDSESGFQYLNQWSYFTPGYESREVGDAFTVYLRKTRGGPTAQTRWTMADGSEIRVTLVNNSVAVSRNGVVIAQRGFTTASTLPWVGVSIALDRTTLWVEGQPLHTVIHDPRFEPWSALEWDRVRVHGAAALAVSYVPLTGWPGFNWPSLRFRGPGAKGLVYDTQCTRTIDPSESGNGATTAKIIGEISAATLTGFWMDEYGVLNWVPSNVLESQPPVETITEDDDIISGSWEETPDSVARRVTATYDEVALTTAATISVTVGGGGSGGQTLQDGGRIEEFVGPGSDEEWIEPDMTPLSAGQNSTVSMRRGLFSMWGGSYVHAEGETEDTTSYGWAMGPNQPDGRPEYLSIDIDPLTPKKWRVSHSVIPGAPQVQLVTLPNSSILPVAWRGVGLPLWRARGRALFATSSVHQEFGPSWARDYTHSLDAWGSRADAQRVALWLAERMSTPILTFDQMQVVPDPRRQLGDVVDARMSKTMGGSFRLLAVGMREETSPGVWRQTIDYRVISATPDRDRVDTYGSAEDLWSTYAEIEDANTTVTYKEVEGT